MKQSSRNLFIEIEMVVKLILYFFLSSEQLNSSDCCIILVQVQEDLIDKPIPSRALG